MLSSSGNCDHCGAEIDKNDEICPKCGFQVRAYQQALVHGNAWVARPGELAGRVDVADLKGFFSKRLTILQGTRAHVFSEGRYIGNVQGYAEYEHDSFLKKLNRLGFDKPASFVITSDRELELELSILEVPTAEYLKLDVELTLGVAIDRENPGAFLALMADKVSFGKMDLQGILFKHVSAVVRSIIKPREIRDLAADANLRDQLDDAIAQRLGELFKRYGLVFSGVHTAAISHQAFDATNDARAKAWIAVDAKRAEMKHARQLQELYTEEQWFEIEKLETKSQLEVKLREVELAKQAALRDAALKAEQEDREARLIDAEDQHRIRVGRVNLLEKAVAQDSREAAITAGAAEELERIRHSAVQSGMLREHETLQWQQEQELLKAELEQERNLKKIDHEREVAIRRLKLEQEYELARYQGEAELAKRVATDERAKQDAELAVQQKLSVFARSEKVKDAELDKQLAQLETDASKVRHTYELERKGSYERLLISLGREKDAADMERRMNELRVAENAYDLERKRMLDEAKIKMDIAARLAQLDMERERAEQKAHLEGRQVDANVEISKSEHLRDIEIARAEASRPRDQPVSDWGELKSSYEKQTEDLNIIIDKIREDKRDDQRHVENLVNTLAQRSENQVAQPPPNVFVNGAPMQAGQPQGHAGATDNEALTNLQLRLARGEISEEEFVRLRALISG